jgi:hypothetical protein
MIWENGHHRVFWLIGYLRFFLFTLGILCNVGLQIVIDITCLVVAIRSVVQLQQIEIVELWYFCLTGEEVAEGPLHCQCEK